jgi:hypothetical protein
MKEKVFIPLQPNLWFQMKFCQQKPCFISSENFLGRRQEKLKPQMQGIWDTWRWEDNIKNDFTETSCNTVDWIRLAQHKLK